MSKLAVIGTIDAASGRRDDVLSALKAHKARVLKHEPGVLKFEILVPREDDTRILLFEVYQDDATFEQHRTKPSITQFREETAGMGVKISITRCGILE
jgi:(4S)-4-hydroxy-5-phosphonooxypentane-2,3-dione isomerase